MLPSTKARYYHICTSANTGGSCFPRASDLGHKDVVFLKERPHTVQGVCLVNIDRGVAVSLK